MSEEKTKISGTVEHVIYRSDESGFTVLELSVEDELVTLVGEAAFIKEGEEISAIGEFKVHSSYGMQFKAELIEHSLPSTASAIMRYLSSGVIKGIGPAFAKRIVEHFGNKTLEIIESDPSQLSQVRGISSARAAEIGEEFKRLFGMRALMLFLSGLGLKPDLSIKIWKLWGAGAAEKIRENPYILCRDEIEIDFDTADEIAGTLGIEAGSIFRICAGVRHVLCHNMRSGHVCLPKNKLLSLSAMLLECSSEEAESGLDTLVNEESAVISEINGVEYVYLPELYAAESYCAQRLKFMSYFLPEKSADFGNEISAIEDKLGITYDEIQRKAISQAVSGNMLILTGGPGTGKTTTLNGIIELLEERGNRVALAAPTGRAAKRMTEVTGREAKTIHRLLEVEPDSPALTFKRNEKNPLNFDTVIIDEMSMVDILIFDSLLKALKMGARLIMVGDTDQLPSVSAGNVLGDLIASEIIPVVHLEKVFRQAAESLIVLNAHAIVKGELPDLSKKDSDFFFLNSSSGKSGQDLVADLVSRRLPAAYKLDPVRDIQVITPGKQGMFGTRELNRLLQQELNPPAPGKSEASVLGRIFREGDKVMQIQNNYDITWEDSAGETGMGVFNGDIGIIDVVDIPSESVVVTFEDRSACYSFSSCNQLEHAYAVTVHKSQGNEFEVVVMPISSGNPKLHYRNLLYTAVTRAKKLLVMLGSRHTVAEMVANNYRTKRYTNLKEMLQTDINSSEQPL